MTCLINSRARPWSCDTAIQTDAQPAACATTVGCYLPRARDSLTSSCSGRRQRGKVQSAKKPLLYPLELQAYLNRLVHDPPCSKKIDAARQVRANISLVALLRPQISDPAGELLAMSRPLKG